MEARTNGVHRSARGLLDEAPDAQVPDRRRTIARPQYHDGTTIAQYRRARHIASIPGTQLECRHDSRIDREPGFLITLYYSVAGVRKTRDERRPGFVLVPKYYWKRDHV